jgi:protoheme IX farnesyltransferase
MSNGSISGGAVRTATPPAAAAVPARRAPLRVASRVHAYAELAKLRLVALVLMTTAVGFALAARADAPLARLAATLAGTFLAAAGAMALNQWAEAPRDALMDRTCQRPLPTGAITPRAAAIFGIVVSTTGLLLLAVMVNPLTATLGLVVVLLYTLVYTPLKTRTPLCTLAGAVCGAIPPLMGWTASGAGLGYGAWLLAGVLFLWQIPHFLSLAWLYRDDYRRGGFLMLPVVDSSGALTSGVAVLYSLALVPVGVLAALGGIGGWRLTVGAAVLGLGLTGLAWRLAVQRTEAAARRVFLATLAYLPLLLGLMVADRTPITHGWSPVEAAASRSAVEATNATVSAMGGGSLTP